jgi:hypothetical protein
MGKLERIILASSASALSLNYCAPIEAQNPISQKEEYTPGLPGESGIPRTVAVSVEPQQEETPTPKSTPTPTETPTPTPTETPTPTPVDWSQLTPEKRFELSPDTIVLDDGRELKKHRLSQLNNSIVLYYDPEKNAEVYGKGQQGQEGLEITFSEVGYNGEGLFNLEELGMVEIHQFVFDQNGEIIREEILDIPYFDLNPLSEDERKQVVGEQILKAYESGKLSSGFANIIDYHSKMLSSGVDVYKGQSPFYITLLFSGEYIIPTYTNVDDFNIKLPDGASYHSNYFIIGWPVGIFDKGNINNFLFGFGFPADENNEFQIYKENGLHMIFVHLVTKEDERCVQSGQCLYRLNPPFFALSLNLGSEKGNDRLEKLLYYFGRVPLPSYPYNYSIVDGSIVRCDTPGSCK